MTAPLSPDEDVRAALEAAEKAFGRLVDPDAKYVSAEIHLPADSHGDAIRRLDDARRALAMIRAALAAPVPEEGPPRGSASAAEPLWRTDVENAPKDRPILGWCDHKADPFYDDENERLTLYAAHAEGLSRVQDGPNVLVWGGDSYEDGGAYLPDWWFLHGSEFEIAANPVKWMEIPALSTEAGNGVASALPSPLPSQGEPVVESERRWIGVVPSGLRGPAKVTRLERVAEIWRDQGLSVSEWVPVEAPAAERARADSLKAELDEARSWGSQKSAELWDVTKDRDALRAYCEKARQLVAAAEARADRAEEALKDCIDTLATVEREASVDPQYGDEVDRLGRRIGFGALMSSAQASWRKYLAETNGHAGGEFVAGPCFATVQGTLRRARNILKETPHGER